MPNILNWHFSEAEEKHYGNILACCEIEIEKIKSETDLQYKIFFFYSLKVVYLNADTI